MSRYIRDLEQEARNAREVHKRAIAAVEQLSARCVLLESAMRVILRHDLMSEWAHEGSLPPVRDAVAADFGMTEPRP